MSDRPRPAKLADRTWVRAAALLTVALLGVYEYFWKLGIRDWFHDEIRYLDVARAYLHGDLLPSPALEPNVHPPFAKYLFGIGHAAFGSSPADSRVVPALSGLAIAVVLFFFARHVTGFWAGVLAAGLWVLVPHPARASEFFFILDRYERYAILDVVAALFVVLGTFLAWRWSETGRWRHVVLAAVALGLASASKVPGVLVVPAIMGLVLVALPRDRRLAAQLVAFPALVGIVALLTYLPFGVGTVEAIGDMIAYQTQRAQFAHSVLNGHFYRGTPAWVHLWYQWDQDGPAVTLALVLGIAAALWMLQRRLAVYLAGVVLLPLGILSLLPVAHPHYRELWLPTVILLVALGVHQLATRRGAAPRALAIVVMIPLLGAGAVEVVRLARAGPQNYALATSLVRRAGLNEATIVVQGDKRIVQQYLPAARLKSRFRPGIPVLILDATDLTTTAGKSQRWDPSGRRHATLAAKARSRGMRHVRVGRLDVWLARGVTREAASG